MRRWIAPAVNVFYSLNLMHGVGFAVAVAFVSLAYSRRLAMPLGVLVMGCAAATLVVPTSLDRTLLDPRRPERNLAISELRSNAAHTTYVVEHPAGKRLYFDGHPMSGTSVGGIQTWAPSPVAFSTVASRSSTVM